MVNTTAVRDEEPKPNSTVTETVERTVETRSDVDVSPWRQVFQSIAQFTITLIAQLVTLYGVQGHPPESFADVYLSVLLALAAALGIWGVSKAPVGNR